MKKIFGMSMAEVGNPLNMSSAEFVVEILSRYRTIYLERL
jgi:hypothetical protein